MITAEGDELLVAHGSTPVAAPGVARAKAGHVAASETVAARGSLQIAHPARPHPGVARPRRTREGLRHHRGAGSTCGRRLRHHHPRPRHVRLRLPAALAARVVPPAPGRDLAIDRAVDGAPGLELTPAWPHFEVTHAVLDRPAVAQPDAARPALPFPLPTGRVAHGLA